jgi:hypothetical protein
MKHIMRNHLFLILLAGAFAAGCGYDNYESPGSHFKGRLVYQGEPINVEKTNSADPNNATVYFELWENGWEKKTPIRVIVDQDGSFSSMLFNATYKLVIPKNQGPFMSRLNEETSSDTIPLSLGSNKTMDIEVTPYYMIRNSQITGVAGGVEATFGLEQIITDVNAKDIERVFLFINKTTFVDGSSQIMRSEIAGGDIVNLADITLSVGVPDMIPAQNYVFARIGVKIAGVDDLMFSGVQKIQL